MPKRLYNLDSVPVVVNEDSSGSVMPGEGHDFTDEQVKAGITGNWSETDPAAELHSARTQRREAAETETKE